MRKLGIPADLAPCDKKVGQHGFDVCCDARLCVMRKSNGQRDVLYQCPRCFWRSEAVSEATLGSGEVANLPSFDFDGAAKAKRKKSPLRESERLDFFTEYDRWLESSPEWRHARVLVMKRDRGVCQDCLEAEATKVHHLNYHRGRFSLLEVHCADLIAICDDCHDKRHERRRYAGDRWMPT